MVYEMGDLLGESERFPDGPRRTVVDVDLDRLRQERMRQGSFDDNADAYAADEGGFRVVPFLLRPPSGDLGLRREVDRFPFVPDDEARLALDCYEAYNIQVSGLEQRMRAIGGGDPARMPTIVIGVSGGLDSTHALIVAAKACDRLGLPRTHILGFTMPGFATTAGTKCNAIHLMESLGITWEELDIRPAATQMLTDLGHPFGRGEEVYDVTFENVQAGLRTDYLFRAANQRGGIVRRHRRPVRARARLVHLRRRRPDVALRRQHRCPEDPDAAPHPLGRLVGPVRGRGQRDPARDPRPGDQPRARADQGGRADPVDRGLRRALRPAGLHALPRAAARLPAEQDRLPRRARVVGCRARRLAGGLPRRRAPGIRPRHDPALDGGLPPPLLRQPVQAVGDPERAEGRRGRVAVAARRLADAVRRRRRARGSPSSRPTSPRPDRPGHTPARLARSDLVNLDRWEYTGRTGRRRAAAEERGLSWPIPDRCSPSRRPGAGAPRSTRCSSTRTGADAGPSPSSTCSGSWAPTTYGRVRVQPRLEQRLGHGTVALPRVHHGVPRDPGPLGSRHRTHLPPTARRCLLALHRPRLALGGGPGARCGRRRGRVGPGRAGGRGVRRRGRRRRGAGALLRPRREPAAEPGHGRARAGGDARAGAPRWGPRDRRRRHRRRGRPPGGVGRAGRRGGRGARDPARPVRLRHAGQG